MADVLQHMITRRVLVVAGAGASRELGDGQPMPLMSDWCDDLTDALDVLEPGTSRVLGLTTGLPGDVFEQRIGALLRLQAELPLFEGLRRLGMTSLIANEEAYPLQWAGIAKRRLDAITETVHENLYRNFGYSHYNDGLAEQAYSRLKSMLTAAGSDIGLAFATTNYDQCIEAAFAAPQWKILDGFRRSPLETPILNATGIAEEWLQATDRIPILHLHGAVGWYRGDDQRIRWYPPDRGYIPALGRPALLLPDPEKTTTSLPGAETLWDEFRKLLAESTHVLFVGHSLNDDHLVEVVAQAGRPTAVLVYSRSLAKVGGPDAEQDDDGTEESATGFVDRVLPGARVIPGIFGPQPEFPEAELHGWLGEGDEDARSRMSAEELAIRRRA
ncbi:MAG: SIR2 family protein [Actinomycetes bacterium]